jgi:hypothetical protein
LTPRITVGLPVYKGADLIAKCLDCLQRQTFGDFEAIISVDGGDAETISVDGGDAETAAACRPFLVDSRFRMVVHPKRLDWVGNFNWLLQQDLREFFCYRQHDDTTAPEFFEVLLRAAEKEPNAAAVYCDCKYSGLLNHIEFALSIYGEPLDRMFQYIERPSATPLRGLIRRAAIRQAGLVRSDEFRAVQEVIVWLAKLVRWGYFQRVAKPLYYRLARPHSFNHEVGALSKDRKRAWWMTTFTGLLEAALPLCRTPEERLFLQQTILEQCLRYPISTEPNSSARFIAECLERLRYEGNTHLLRVEELPPILQELQRRSDEIKLFERSRIRRVIYRIRQRHRMGRLVYSRSRMQRVIYQIRHLVGELRYKMGSLLVTG